MTRRTALWTAALVGLFVFRLLFGLSSEFFSQDETQIFLLGLRYYSTGSWPHFGPDVVWTMSEVPGALQALFVGLPLGIVPVPEAPFVLLNLLSMGALSGLAWYICRRLPTIPSWLVWGWLLTIPWTLQFSTHINNPSYVLPAAIMFFVAFFETVPALNMGVLRPVTAHFMMGLAIAWVMQIHLSWPLLLPYTLVAWLSRRNDGAAALATNALALAVGALVPGVLLLPTFLKYGLAGGSGGAFRNLDPHWVNPTVAVTTLARFFSFASLEIVRFVGIDTAKRLVFFQRHLWLLPFAIAAWAIGIVQPLWMLREWFRRASPHHEWPLLKTLIVGTIALLYVVDWFVIERATEAHAFYVLAPIAFVFAAYCWTFIDSPAWRSRAAFILAVNICFHAGLAWAQAPAKSLYKRRDVVVAAVRTKQPEKLAHRRPFAIEPGPLLLQDPSRPYDAVQDIEAARPAYVRGIRGMVLWTVTLHNRNPRVAFRDVLCETTYRTETGEVLEVKRTSINEIFEPGEARKAEINDGFAGSAFATATLRVVAAEALLPVETGPGLNAGLPGTTTTPPSTRRQGLD